MRFETNFKETEIWKIPEDWEVVELGNYIDIQDNLRKPLSWTERSIMKWNYPYYWATEIMDYINDYIFDWTFLLLAEDWTVKDKNWFPILQLVSWKFWVNNHTHIISENSTLPLKYLYYILSNTNVEKYITGAVQLKINQGNLKKIKIPITKNKIEQQKIADFLWTIDDKIELNNQINKKLEETAQAMFKSWFIDFEPFKDWEFVDSEMGKIPKGWRVGKLGEVVDVVWWWTPSTKNPNYYIDKWIPWITPKDLSWYSLKFIERWNRDISDLGLAKSSAKLMPKWTILFSSRAPIWYVVISNNPVSTNQWFKSLVPHNWIWVEYIYYSMIHKRDYISSIATGSTFKEVSWWVMKNIDILIPPKMILIDFDYKISYLSEKMKLIDLENQKLTEIKEYFLPKLISGEIRLID